MSEKQKTIQELFRGLLTLQGTLEKVVSHSNTRTPETASKASDTLGKLEVRALQGIEQLVETPGVIYLVVQNQAAPTPAHRMFDDEHFSLLPQASNTLQIAPPTSRGTKIYLGITNYGLQELELDKESLLAGALPGLATLGMDPCFELVRRDNAYVWCPTANLLHPHIIGAEQRGHGTVSFNGNTERVGVHFIPEDVAERIFRTIGKSELYKEGRVLVDQTEPFGILSSSS